MTILFRLRKDLADLMEGELSQPDPNFDLLIQHVLLLLGWRRSTTITAALVKLMKGELSKPAPDVDQIIRQVLKLLGRSLNTTAAVALAELFEGELSKPAPDVDLLIRQVLKLLGLRRNAAPAAADAETAANTPPRARTAQALDQLKQDYPVFHYKNRYIEELLFKDYYADESDVWQDYGHGKYGRLPTHAEANTYLISVLWYRCLGLATTSAAQDKPTNTHLLLECLCQLSAAPGEWDKTLISSLSEGAAKGADLTWFRKLYKTLFERFASQVKYWLTAGEDCAAPLGEKLCFDDVCRFAPAPLQSGFAKDEKFSRLLLRVLESLNERYGLLRGCGLPPERWLERDQPSITKLHDLVALREAAIASPRWATHTEAAYRQAFATVLANKRQGEKDDFAKRLHEILQRLSTPPNPALPSIGSPAQRLEADGSNGDPQEALWLKTFLALPASQRLGYWASRLGSDMPTRNSREALLRQMFLTLLAMREKSGSDFKAMLANAVQALHANLGLPPKYRLDKLLKTLRIGLEAIDADSAFESIFAPLLKNKAAKKNPDEDEDTGTLAGFASFDEWALSNEGQEMLYRGFSPLPENEDGELESIDDLREAPDANPEDLLSELDQWDVLRRDAGEALEHDAVLGQFFQDTMLPSGRYFGDAPALIEDEDFSRTLDGDPRYADLPPKVRLNRLGAEVQALIGEMLLQHPSLPHLPAVDAEFWRWTRVLQKSEKSLLKKPSFQALLAQDPRYAGLPEDEQLKRLRRNAARFAEWLLS